MKTASIRIACALALATLLIPNTFAQTHFRQNAEAVPQVAPYSGCLMRGTGDQSMIVCFTVNGNLTLFESPEGQEQMKGIEGYAVCYGPGGSTVAFDNDVDASGWKASVVTGTGFNRTITRVTTDGKLQWKQTFSADTIEKDVTIKVELKNVSTAPVFVQGFSRYYDDLIDNSSLGDIADRTADSVMAREVNGLSLTGITDRPVTTIYAWDAINYRVCSQTSNVTTPTAPGDWAARVFIPMGFKLPPGGFESATFVYRRY